MDSAYRCGKHLPRTTDHAQTQHGADDVLRATIISGGWMVSDCESEGETAVPKFVPHESPPEPEPPNQSDQEEEETTLPKIDPHVKSEGHQKICDVFLPELFRVLKDPRYATKAPRDQVKETCWRALPLPLHVYYLFCIIIYY